MLKLIVTSIAILISSSFSFGQTGSLKMNFAAKAPTSPILLGTAWTIYATGHIDPESGKRFEQFLIDNKIPLESHLYLDSPGGSVVGGMELGQVIRKFRLRTDVGRRDTAGELKPGECFSACALAFLGGEFRYLMTGSRYGVHRFSFKKETSANVDLAQVMSAAIAEYIRTMDVDLKFLSLSAITGSDDMFEPTGPQLSSLRVVNNGYSSAKWSLESMDNGIYLKGERNTTHGINKFIIGCEQSNPILYVVIDPQGRGEMIARFRADSLYVDGRAYRVGNLLREKSS